MDARAWNVDRYMQTYYVERKIDRPNALLPFSPSLGLSSALGTVRRNNNKL